MIETATPFPQRRLIAGLSLPQRFAARKRVGGPAPAENGCQLEDKHLEWFFRHSQDMHCLISFDGFLRRVNPACEKITGFTAAELLARPCLEWIHSDDRPAFRREMGRLLRGAEVSAFEVRCRSQDGRTLWTHWGATPLSDRRLVVATGRNITARKHAEEAVRQSEEHYRELFHEAYQMQLALRHVSENVHQLQERERARLSRDLHDEIGQALTAIGIHLSALQRGVAGADPELARRAEDARALLQHTAESVHRFARELRPAMLDDLGLLPALRTHVLAFSARTGLALDFHVEAGDGIENIHAEGKTAIFRIVQEGLNNIAKHAGATEIELAIGHTTGEVTAMLRDNGCGFDTVGFNAGQCSGRLGLVGIRERVRLVNGTLEIDSKPGAGTVLRVSIPLEHSRSGYPPLFLGADLPSPFTPVQPNQ